MYVPGMAACHMSKGEFEDAEKLLQEARSKVTQHHITPLCGPLTNRITESE